MSERQLANLKRWPKGVSGNPKGRPKTKTLSEHYRAQLNHVAPDDPDGRTYGELIALAIVRQAAAGEIAAARELADRTEGRAVQSVGVNMAVTDWRELAAEAGLSEQDIIRETRELLAEFTVDGGNTSSD